MAMRFNAPSVEPIPEDEEVDEVVSLGDPEEESRTPASQPPRRSHEAAMKSDTGKDKERPRKHKSTTGTKHSRRSRNVTGKRAGASSSRGNSSDSSRRHRSSRHAGPYTSSSDEEVEIIPDHRAVLAAARARLTSPSMLSTATSQTTATNKSSSSSGSNSTITQLSVTRRSALGKRPEIAEEPLSPAVPDPPNVFAFLEEDVPHEAQKAWFTQVYELPSTNSDHDAQVSGSTSSPIHKSPPSVALSTSSSAHGDENSSEPAAENDTDRSSSPERSVKGLPAQEEIQEGPIPTDSTSEKIASQLAAAHQRQNSITRQQFGTPEMPRGPASLPHVPSTALNARHFYQPHVLPRAEKLPVTGYELLASRLSSSSTHTEGDGERIKPMYRKFEALNHRLILHLQDELSELEEQLHRLDSADTQSRRTDRYILPASRRAAAQAGGELQWHKTDILGRIGFKLNQYNAALASFNSTQALACPDSADVDRYRSYLQTEHLIAESETHFLDPVDDLVSLYSEPQPSSTRSESSYTSSAVSCSVTPSASSHHSSPTAPSPPAPPTEMLDAQTESVASPLPAVATAVAVAVLVPIITFNVIPGFIGRMTVTLLVGSFMVWALVQSNIVDRVAPLGREGVTCLAIYGAVMTVIAGMMA